MKEFDAQKLLRSARCLLENAQLAVSVREKGVVDPVMSGVLTQVKNRGLDLLECCKTTGLPLSVMAMDRLLHLLEIKLSQKTAIDSLVSAAQRVVITVEDELSLRTYLALEPTEAERYTKPLEGWEEVVMRFENSKRDIEEMNRCFALCRYTASMFHALHVAEWGAVALGTYIGVSDPKLGWGPTERKLRELLKAGHLKLPASLTGKFEFLEQMGREIDSMVLAWRHKVDHAANHLAIVPNAEFTPDIAQHIIDSVRVFMNRLVDGIPTLT